MSPRERVIKALSREIPDRVPFEFSFTPYLQEIFKQKTGADDPREYFGMEIRHVSLKPTRIKQDFSAYISEESSEISSIDEYGVGRIKGSTYHFTRMVHPLRKLSRREELEKYPFPDICAEYRYEGIAEEVEQLHARDLFVVGWVGDIFETAWAMRGMIELFQDFLINQEFAAYLLDKITEDRCFMAENFARAGVDMILLGDDVGMQEKMMMGPETWEEWLKPRLAKVIASAKKINPEIFVFYHSDGNIEEIIPGLIEAGVDVLNPVQPECMDPAEIKEKYGDKLSFWGTIGTQTTMPFATPEEVKREVKLRVETVGKNGGLVLAPTHILEPDVPWENILAFVEGVKESEEFYRKIREG